MTDIPDRELLADFAQSKSEAAFAELVRRHIALVHSVALRHTDNPQSAQEITQAVFIILARKAASLRAGTVLGGWLHHAARLAAANFRRAEFRRIRRDQEAFMQSTMEEAGPDAAWQAMAPLLDEAVAHLGATDRAAVVLRYFENKSLAEVGAALGSSEDAAKKRVARALEKLRKIFNQRGVTLTAAVIAGAVAANSVQAAPPGLAAAVTATAAKGTSISATITTLVNGTMKTITWWKLKFAIGITAGLLLAGGVVTMAIAQAESHADGAPLVIVKQSLEAYAALSSYSDDGTTLAEGGGHTSSGTFSIRLQRPNFYRIDWTHTGENIASQGVVWSDGGADYFVSVKAGNEQNAHPQKMSSMQMALAAATGISGSATSIPATFYRQNFGEVLAIAASGRLPLELGRNENVGAAACYVISYQVDTAKMLAGEARVSAAKAGNSGITATTLWIGKQDHLIHKMRTITEGMSLNLPAMSDDKLKTMLESQNQPATPEAITTLRTRMVAMLKQMQGAKIILTQTHENIIVNQKLTAADFAR